MNIFQTLLKQLPVLAALTLLTGCVVWTNIPSSYAEKDKYSVIASVHGVKQVTFSTDLHKIVISYNPTNEITLDTNTIHGWLIQIPPAKKQFAVTEYFVLPKAAKWPKGGRWQVVSLDQTTCMTFFIVPEGAKYIDHEWGMSATDPLGKYEIIVFFDDKLAGDFKFNVVGK